MNQRVHGQNKGECDAHGQLRAASDLAVGSTTPQEITPTIMTAKTRTAIRMSWRRARISRSSRGGDSRRAASGGSDMEERPFIVPRDFVYDRRGGRLSYRATQHVPCR